MTGDPTVDQATKVQNEYDNAGKKADKIESWVKAFFADFLHELHRMEHKTRFAWGAMLTKLSVTVIPSIMSYKSEKQTQQAAGLEALNLANTYTSSMLQALRQNNYTGFNDNYYKLNELTGEGGILDTLGVASQINSDLDMFKAMLSDPNNPHPGSVASDAFHSLSTKQNLYKHSQTAGIQKWQDALNAFSSATTATSNLSSTTLTNLQASQSNFNKILGAVNSILTSIAKACQSAVQAGSRG